MKPKFSNFDQEIHGKPSMAAVLSQLWELMPRWKPWEEITQANVHRYFRNVILPMFANFAMEEYDYTKIYASEEAKGLGGKKHFDSWMMIWKLMRQISTSNHYEKLLLELLISGSSHRESLNEIDLYSAHFPPVKSGRL